MATVRKRNWRAASGEEKTAWIADYFDGAGKRHIKTFRTRKAADEWLVNARGEVQRGTHTPENASITVREAATLWLERCALEGLERSTLRFYKIHVDLHILPRIGGERLARLTTPRIEAFRDALLRDDVSRATARKALTTFKSILTDAQRRGLLAHNVASPVRIDIKRRESGKLVVGRDLPSPAEVQVLLGTADGRWRPFFVTAIFTGMRASELRGLAWDALDFDRRVIHVRQRANLWRELGPPKSAAGHREIPMSPLVANTLREWQLACPPGPLNLVFPNTRGNVDMHANIVDRAWGPLQRASGLVDVGGKTKYGLHALRHFFASWAIDQGFSPKRVQVLLGHSSIQITFDVYGHLFPSLEDDHAKFAAGELTLVGAAG